MTGKRMDSADRGSRHVPEFAAAAAPVDFPHLHHAERGGPPLFVRASPYVPAEKE